jgi:Zn-dependent protease
MIVSLAGVATNLVLAIVITIIYAFFLRWVVSNLLLAAWVLTTLEILRQTVRINLVLMVFNLLPIPPLDGFNFITGLLGIKYTEAYYRMYQYGMFILMALIVFRVVRTILSMTVNPMYSTLIGIAERWAIRAFAL